MRCPRQGFVFVLWVVFVVVAAVETMIPYSLLVCCLGALYVVQLTC
jgi:hypothetical protein